MFLFSQVRSPVQGFSKKCQCISPKKKAEARDAPPKFFSSQQGPVGGEQLPAAVASDLSNRPSPCVSGVCCMHLVWPAPRVVPGTEVGLGRPPDTQNGGDQVLSEKFCLDIHIFLCNLPQSRPEHNEGRPSTPHHVDSGNSVFRFCDALTDGGLGWAAIQGGSISVCTMAAL